MTKIVHYFDQRALKFDSPVFWIDVDCVDCVDCWKWLKSVLCRSTYIKQPSKTTNTKRPVFWSLFFAFGLIYIVFFGNAKKNDFWLNTNFVGNIYLKFFFAGKIWNVNFVKFKRAWKLVPTFDVTKTRKVACFFVKSSLRIYKGGSLLIQIFMIGNIPHQHINLPAVDLSPEGGFIVRRRAG